MVDLVMYQNELYTTDGELKHLNTQDIYNKHAFWYNSFIVNFGGIEMSEINNKVLKTLNENKICCIATTGEKYVDNAMLAYYADAFDLYFGSFSDTLKCRNIKVNPHVAICVDNLQFHGKAQLIKHSSDEYFFYMEKYLTKFPHYKYYFELQNNELYRVTPLVIWYYDSSKGTMHRDMIVFDNDYYKKLLPYEAPIE